MPFRVGDRIRAIRNIHQIVQRGFETTVVRLSGWGGRIDIVVPANESMITGNGYRPEDFELIGAAPEGVEQFLVINDQTRRVLPLEGSDAGIREACLAQIARWFTNPARTAAQRTDTTFHLIPLRSLDRVNINGVVEDDG